jgi:hypothetical protein
MPTETIIYNSVRISVWNDIKFLHFIFFVLFLFYSFIFIFMFSSLSLLYSINVFPTALADYTPNAVAIHPSLSVYQLYWLSPCLLITTLRAPLHIESTSQCRLSFLLRLLTLEHWPIHCSKTSVNNYDTTPRNIPEEHRSHLFSNFFRDICQNKNFAKCHNTIQTHNTGLFPPFTCSANSPIFSWLQLSFITWWITNQLMNFESIL